MTRDKLLKKAVMNLKKLPDHKLQEITDYMDFILKSVSDQELVQGMQVLASTSKAYDFLKEDEDLYTVNDLKETYK